MKICLEDLKKNQSIHHFAFFQMKRICYGIMNTFFSRELSPTKSTIPGVCVVAALTGDGGSKVKRRMYEVCHHFKKLLLLDKLRFLFNLTKDRGVADGVFKINAGTDLVLVVNHKFTSMTNRCEVDIDGFFGLLNKLFIPI